MVHHLLVLCLFFFATATHASTMAFELKRPMTFAAGVNTLGWEGKLMPEGGQFAEYSCAITLPNQSLATSERTLRPQIIRIARVEHGERAVNLIPADQRLVRRITCSARVLFSRRMVPVTPTAKSLNTVFRKALALHGMGRIGQGNVLSRAF